jgi:hypothetical protein
MILQGDSEDHVFDAILDPDRQSTGFGEVERKE